MRSKQLFVTSLLLAGGVSAQDCRIDSLQTYKDASCLEPTEAGTFPNWSTSTSFEFTNGECGQYFSGVPYMQIQYFTDGSLLFDIYGNPQCTMQIPTFNQQLTASSGDCVANQYVSSAGPQTFYWKVQATQLSESDSQNNNQDSNADSADTDSTTNGDSSPEEEKPHCKIEQMARYTDEYCTQGYLSMTSNVDVVQDKCGNEVGLGQPSIVTCTETTVDIQMFEGYDRTCQSNIYTYSGEDKQCTKNVIQGSEWYILVKFKEEEVPEPVEEPTPEPEPEAEVEETTCKIRSMKRYTDSDCTQDEGVFFEDHEFPQGECKRDHDLGQPVIVYCDDNQASLHMYESIDRTCSNRIYTYEGKDKVCTSNVIDGREWFILLELHREEPEIVEMPMEEERKQMVWNFDMQYSHLSNNHYKGSFDSQCSKARHCEGGHNAMCCADVSMINTVNENTISVDRCLYVNYVHENFDFDLDNNRNIFVTARCMWSSLSMKLAATNLIVVLSTLVGFSML